MSHNIPRLFTALAEWCACIVCICRYDRHRIHGIRLLVVSALALLVQGAFLNITGAWPLVWWVPCMLAAIALMLGLIWLCCDMRPTTAVYCTLRAFLLAELTASLEWQLYYYTAGRFPVLREQTGMWTFLVLIYGGVFLLVFWLDSHREGAQDALVFQWKELWPPFLIAAASFSMSNLSFISSDTPFSGDTLLDIHNIRTLVDLAGLISLYAYHIQRCELFARRELDAIQNVLQNQYAQYRQSRESIDAINRRYHDLKHHIAVLRTETDPVRRSAFLDGIEEDIRAYEAQNKTGHPVLDTVLTGKSLYCARHGIELTCVADGALLSFMDAMDICTIFGNLLDNAIECQLRIADKSKRLVHLTVHGRKGFLIIQSGNYCERMPQFKDGLPLTTKDDAGCHGYGVKSILYTTEKYGGTMTIHTRDNWFEVTLLIPDSQN